MEKTESRWGWHPCPYEVYEKLKRLNEGWQLYVRMAAKQRRYDAKTKYKGRIWMYGKPIDFCDATTFSRSRAEYILTDYQNARRPKENPEDVVPLTLSIEKIDSFHDRYEAYIEEMLEKHRKMMQDREDGFRKNAEFHDNFMDKFKNDQNADRGRALMEAVKAAKREAS